MEQNLRFDQFNVETHGPLVESLTHLLHQAYAPLAAKGMRYLATHQPPEKTLERLKGGESFLVFHDDSLAGTVTLYREKTDGTCEYYKKPGVFSFGQFAIHPDLQGRGIGSHIMDRLEARAKELGAKELALDTSERADNLIQMYEKRGYQIVAHTQWEDTNYRSVIMSKWL